jgi:hypothetical protein
MDLFEVESVLREKLSVHSVQDLEKFPSDSYSNFLTQHKTGQLRLLTTYDSEAFNLLATRAEMSMHYILTWSPALVSIVLVATSIAQWNFYLLLGIPLALLGFLFTTPGLIRSFGYTLLLIVGGLAVYNWVRGNSTAAYILSAYAASNFLVDVAREQCSLTLIGAVLKSELVLVWLYLKGSLRIKEK